MPILQQNEFQIVAPCKYQQVARIPMPTPFEIIKKEDHGIWNYDANRSDDFGIDIW